ncbi:hypothetical protein [Kibdelosporangium phytohabitans]|uniref:hypothetical protein n=1 Tax=Kibdelosporangium phytohabitans TaxID=860235 RepID=UPI0012F9556A|nr:hypothetical protein [Kibdelosporangium phytohabitans]MBE1461502.1 hypothetical protein [Kibdelosporangium phytohabitans]
MIAAIRPEQARLPTPCRSWDVRDRTHRFPGGEVIGDRRFRGDEADGFHVAPEVVVPGDALLHDRFAAFNGRSPSSR